MRSIPHIGSIVGKVTILIFIFIKYLNDNLKYIIVYPYSVCP